MSGKIYWLASYPKSGNTWLRILLTNYLRNAGEPADINSLDGGPIASARQVFDDNVGVEASDLTQDEIERYRPFVYDLLSARATEPLFLKVHDAYTRTAAGVPLLSKSATAGAIYLLRNPLDVAVSFAHHSATTVERMVERMGDPAFAFVENPHKLHNQLRQHLLTWSGHVTSWVDEPGLRIHIVRYEDLKADTIAQFTAVLRFCGLPVEPGRVAKAVEFSRFERVKAQEEAHGFGEKMPKASSFFRKGVVGSWREELAADQVERIIVDHGEVMRRFGYLTADGDPIY
ncbi:MAG: sulfotransferase domain-containing protein [Caldilineaceae bacterium]|nr:sulfotransferase domain-containing protein [Caldilineaceae bacterium]